MRTIHLSDEEYAKARRRAGFMPFVVTDARQGFLYFVTSRPALSLSKELRQQAAADDALEWDAGRRGYRLRRGHRKSSA